MRSPLTTFAFVFAIAACACGQEDACAVAEEHFAKGELFHGQSVLVRALRGEDLSPEERAVVMERLARFYEDEVGSLEKAMKVSLELLELELRPHHPAKSAARERIARLQAHAAKYREEDALLKKVRSETHKSDEVQARIAELQALIDRCPDYMNLARAYCYLGANLTVIERYGEAYEAFVKALELRPGLKFHFPVEYRMRIAYRNWLRQLATKTAWSILGLILLASAAGFYFSRPWKWLGLRHAAALAAMLALWWAVFSAAVWLLGSGVSVEEYTFEKPVFLEGLPGSPGSEVLDILFRYGLVGVIGAFVIAVETARFRLRWTWAFMNGAAALALFACLTTVFYLRHCDYTGLVEPQEESALPYLNGTTYFLLRDVEPFILTNPRAYPGLTTSSMDEPVVRNWIEKQYSIITPQKEKGPNRAGALEEENQP